jgi:hypothetical protein
MFVVLISVHLKFLTIKFHTTTQNFSVASTSEVLKSLCAGIIECSEIKNVVEYDLWWNNVHTTFHDNKSYYSGTVSLAHTNTCSQAYAETQYHQPST